MVNHGRPNASVHGVSDDGKKREDHEEDNVEHEEEEGYSLHGSSVSAIWEDMEERGNGARPFKQASSVSLIEGYPMLSMLLLTHCYGVPCWDEVPGQDVKSQSLSLSSVQNLPAQQAYLIRSLSGLYGFCSIPALSKVTKRR